MSLRRLVSAAAAAALLFAGLTNAHAHVHLCFDGSEAPATLHWATGEAVPQAHGDEHVFPHDHHGGAHSAAALDGALDEGGHDDVDLEVSASAIAKTVKHDALAATPPDVLLLSLAPPPATRILPASDLAPRAPPARTRPQPRAPPTFS
jgi:hypothetical protein